MKLFGEFLLEKKIVSVDELAEALIEQVTAIPPSCEIIHQHSLLTSEQILQVFKQQQVQRVDFDTAGRSLGLYTAEVEQKLAKEIDQKRTPIGHILIKKGLTDLQVLTKMLDEFLSTVEPSKDEPEVTTPKANPSPLKLEGKPIDAALALELETNFSEIKKEELLNLLFLAQQNIDNKELIQEFLSDFSKNCHSLVGMTKFLNLNFLSGYLSAIDSLVQNVLEGRYASENEKANKLDLIIRGFALSWKIRSGLISGQSEHEFADEINNLIADFNR